MTLVVEMSGADWNSSTVHVTSGRDVETQAACDAEVGLANATVLCIPVVIIVSSSDSGGSSRRLHKRALAASALTSLPSAVVVGLTVRVPAAVRSQLSDPNTYLAIQNTQDTGSASASPCPNASTTYDATTGTVNAVSCGYGAYSVRVLRDSVATSGGGVGGGTVGGQESGSGLAAALSGGSIAGVVVAVVAVVILAVAGVVVAKRHAARSRATGKVIPVGASGSPDARSGRGKPRGGGKAPAATVSSRVATTAPTDSDFGSESETRKAMPSHHDSDGQYGSRRRSRSECLDSPLGRSRSGYDSFPASPSPSQGRNLTRTLSRPSSPAVARTLRALHDDDVAGPAAVFHSSRSMLSLLDYESGGGKSQSFRSPRAAATSTDRTSSSISIGGGIGISFGGSPLRDAAIRSAEQLLANPALLALATTPATLPRTTSFLKPGMGGVGSESPHHSLRSPSSAKGTGHDSLTVDRDLGFAAAPGLGPARGVGKPAKLVLPAMDHRSRAAFSPLASATRPRDAVEPGRALGGTPALVPPVLTALHVPSAVPRAAADDHRQRGLDDCVFEAATALGLEDGATVLTSPLPVKRQVAVAPVTFGDRAYSAKAVGGLGAAVGGGNGSGSVRAGGGRGVVVVSAARAAHGSVDGAAVDGTITNAGHSHGGHGQGHGQGSSHLGSHGHGHGHGGPEDVLAAMLADAERTLDAATPGAHSNSGHGGGVSVARPGAHGHGTPSRGSGTGGGRPKTASSLASMLVEAETAVVASGAAVVAERARPRPVVASASGGTGTSDSESSEIAAAGSETPTGTRGDSGHGLPPTRSLLAMVAEAETVVSGVAVAADRLRLSSGGSRPHSPSRVVQLAAARRNDHADWERPASSATTEAVTTPHVRALTADCSASSRVVAGRAGPAHGGTAAVRDATFVHRDVEPDQEPDNAVTALFAGHSPSVATSGPIRARTAVTGSARSGVATAALASLAAGSAGTAHTPRRSEAQNGGDGGVHRYRDEDAWSSVSGRGSDLAAPPMSAERSTMLTVGQSVPSGSPMTPTGRVLTAASRLGTGRSMVSMLPAGDGSVTPPAPAGGLADLFQEVFQAESVLASSPRHRPRTGASAASPATATSTPRHAGEARPAADTL